MGRPQQQQNELVRIVRTGADVALTVVGAAPAVARVLGTKPNRMLEFSYDEVEAETFHGGMLWPTELFTPGQLIYGAAWVVNTAVFRPVDLVVIYSGATKYGTHAQTYYLWQADASRQPLTALSLLDLRGALASPWVDHWRTTSAFRGIVLR